MPPSLPDSVRKLVQERIDSVPELEAILLMRGHRDRAWTAEEVGRRLYVSTAVAEHILHILTERGFLANRDAGYVFDPETPDLATAVEELASAYVRHLIEVTHMIHAKPSISVRQFADAFRLRKK